jgi:hypothetical protein
MCRVCVIFKILQVKFSTFREGFYTCIRIQYIPRINPSNKSIIIKYNYYTTPLLSFQQGHGHAQELPFDDKLHYCAAIIHVAKISQCLIPCIKTIFIQIYLTCRNCLPNRVISLSLVYIIKVFVITVGIWKVSVITF